MCSERKILEMKSLNQAFDYHFARTDNIIQNDTQW